jgi:dipeptidyl-peptidase 4
MKSAPRAMIFALVLALGSLALVGAQAPPAGKANYELASRWTAAKVGKLVFDGQVQPRWLESGERFWYSYETSRGRQWWIVAPAAKSRQPLFDNAKMAALLTKTTLFPYDAQHLPIRTIKFIKKDTAIRFDVEVPKDADVRVGDVLKKAGDVGKEFEDKEKEKEKEQDTQKKDLDKKDQDKKDAEKPKEPESKTKTLFFEYELASGRLKILEDYKAPEPRPRWASVSPDEKTVVFGRGYNLYMMDAESFKKACKKADDKEVKEVQLTTEGEEYYSWTRELSDEDKKTFQKDEKDRKDYRVPAAGVIWSKDSRKFSADREDERKVGALWVINSLSNPRPTLETYKYAMPGEEAQPQPELWIFDAASKGRVQVKAEKYKDQTLSVFTSPRKAADMERDYPPPPVWLGDRSDLLYLGRQSRDLHRFELCTVGVEKGEVKPLFEEILNTYVDVQPPRLVDGGKEIVWWSERDGWGHYYLYDGTGKLKGQITSGEYVCAGIENLDDKARTLYFNAWGREPGEDPYYAHLYRVNLDGSGLKLLNPGNANHSAGMNEAGRWIVDGSSRVDQAPQ